MSPTPTNAEGLAKWLKQLRKKAGLSQEDTAAALKTSRRNVVRWESVSPTEPGALMLLRMLSLYGVRIEPAPKGYAPADVASVIEAIADQIAALQRQVIAAIARERAEQPPRDGGASLPHEAVERGERGSVPVQWLPAASTTSCPLVVCRRNIGSALTARFYHHCPKSQTDLRLG